MTTSICRDFSIFNGAILVHKVNCNQTNVSRGWSYPYDITFWQKNVGARLYVDAVPDGESIRDKSRFDSAGRIEKRSSIVFFLVFISTLSWRSPDRILTEITSYSALNDTSSDLTCIIDTTHSYRTTTLTDSFQLNTIRPIDVSRRRRSKSTFRSHMSDEIEFTYTLDIDISSSYGYMQHIYMIPSSIR